MTQELPDFNEDLILSREFVRNAIHEMQLSEHNILLYATLINLCGWGYLKGISQKNEDGIWYVEISIDYLNNAYSDNQRTMSTLYYQIRQIEAAGLIRRRRFKEYTRFYLMWEKSDEWISEIL